MRLNDDGKTVAAMDVLVPRVGELIGGSQREERLDYLDNRLDELKLSKESLGWYRDLRSYGTGSFDHVACIRKGYFSSHVAIECQVRRIRHEEEIDVHDHKVLTREIVPTLKPLEETIRENVFCLGTQKDHGTRRGRQSTSFSSAFDQPSSSHLNDDDDGNGIGTLRTSTPSP
nr:asparagine--tRNA ligase, chloroplastic/mitochondrial [Tanacetum cinerariifolium]